MTNKIRYKIVDGALPVGVKFNGNTGMFSGSIDFINTDQGPSWQTPVSVNLGTYDELSTVDIGPFSAVSSKGLPVSFGTLSDGNNLPLGIYFDHSTNKIVGTISELIVGGAVEFLNRNGPEWQTEFGKLGGYDVSDTVDVTVSATPYADRTLDNYSIIEDGLPWGLTLNKLTGKITGTIAELKAPGITIEEPKLPLPAWQTPQGAIAVLKETEVVSTPIVIQAEAAPGRTIVKYTIRSGGLPWGLVVNQTTGEITGSVAELRGFGDPAYYENDKDPSIDLAVEVQGVVGNYANASSFGTFSKGTTVTIKLSSTPYSGRTIRRWTLDSGSLPLGLSINPTTGQITGTVTNNTITSTGGYTFSIKVFDNTGAWSVRTYTLTVQ